MIPHRQLLTEHARFTEVEPESKLINITRPWIGVPPKLIDK